jgi:hypothetical protein
LLLQYAAREGNYLQKTGNSFQWSVVSGQWSELGAGWGRGLPSAGFNKQAVFALKNLEFCLKSPGFDAKNDALQTLPKT